MQITGKNLQLLADLLEQAESGIHTARGTAVLESDEDYDWDEEMQQLEAKRAKLAARVQRELERSQHAKR